MPAETDEEALEVELNADARLDAADACFRRCTRLVCGASLEVRMMMVCLCGDCASDGALEERKRKREMLKSPDGVKVKRAAVIEDSDSDSDYLG